MLEIRFDVLLHPLPSGIPSLVDLEAFIPNPGDLEICGRWLCAQGVEAHSTGVSLACRAPVALFETLFAVRVVSRPGESGEFHLEMEGKPVPPPPIAPYVADLCLTRRPVFLV